MTGETGVARKLWLAEPIEWLPYGLPAADLPTTKDVPDDILCRLYPDATTYGPNWSNVLRLNKKLIWLIENVGYPTSHFDETVIEIGFDGANKLPERVLIGLTYLSQELPQVRASSVTFIANLLLQHTAWDGFALGDVNDRYTPQTAARSFGISFDGYHWKQPE